MRKLKDWVYKFDSYHLWFYKNGDIFMTKHYVWLGKMRVGEIRVGSDVYHGIMSTENVIWHEDCE